ncbi:MAG: hypothetical protein KF758_09080 [Anaerolineales bacterium]|nr:hypothetical protein [Anaerolineales bacterium]
MKAILLFSRRSATNWQSKGIFCNPHIAVFLPKTVTPPKQFGLLFLPYLLRPHNKAHNNPLDKKSPLIFCLRVDGTIAYYGQEVKRA